MTDTSMTAIENLCERLCSSGFLDTKSAQVFVQECVKLKTSIVFLDREKMGCRIAPVRSIAGSSREAL
jgi:hypothetical protein